MRNCFIMGEMSNATPELSSLSFVAETSRKCSGNEPLALLYCVSHCTSLYFVVCSRWYSYISNSIIIFNTTTVMLLTPVLPYKYGPLRVSH